MANNDDFKKVLARNVTLQYPKLNSTHRFNTQTQRSEPCAPTASNAAWSVAFDMTKEQAKPLYEDLRGHYEACKSRNPKMPAFKTVFGMKKLKDANGNDTGVVQFTAKRNGMKKDGTPNKQPIVIDGQKNPMDDLNFWGGSIGTVRAWAVAVVDPDGNGGISLLLDAIQVTEARFGDGGMDDFEDVEPEAKSGPFETKTEKSSTAKRAAPKEDFEDEIPF
jgi:hypothetical protein